jgi:hypothetical protein
MGFVSVEYKDNAYAGFAAHKDDDECKIFDTGDLPTDFYDAVAFCQEEYSFRGVMLSSSVDDLVADREDLCWSPSGLLVYSKDLEEASQMPRNVLVGVAKALAALDDVSYAWKETAEGANDITEAKLLLLNALVLNGYALSAPGSARIKKVKSPEE